MTTIRKVQLIALRARLNKMGDWYYSNSASIVALDRTAEWNKRRIRLRNRINRRLAEG